MSKSYEPNKKKSFTREAIIGLGEDSFRKNYYPELQDHLLELERINSRNKALITTIPDILLVSDIKGNISPFNVSRLNNNAMILNIMKDQKLIQKLREVVSQVVLSRLLVTYDFHMEVDNRTYYFEARIHISAFDEVLIMIRDMTDRITLENRLRTLVDKDNLCQVFNRRYFEYYLTDFNMREITSFTIIIVDIDGLKLINDTLGHLSGDRVIISVAELIEKTFDHFGMISRIGGDEFGIVLHGFCVNDIESFLDTLKGFVKEHNLKTESVELSLSYGYGHHESGVLNVDHIFQEADNNMYQNKLLKTSSTKNNLVKTLMKALEAKDYITEGHADRMEMLATIIGHELKLPQNIIDRIQLLTKFHDIGKVGIPDSILKKPGALTSDEWKVMCTHCSIGERIANESTELKDIAHLILKHQERWDGKGYPLGLAGEEIPLECRILAIADTFDAMTNDRPYRKALPMHVAIEEILSQAGTQFDPEMVKVFHNVVFKVYPL
ncbi:bifunctional diguanylate cyclase/phosphohydrolase [Petrocella sp. FN5]|uniref:bifunctional diguanylate cyclase/phosphohydrolase n=1 Tax=Petrocella sp. FN5 TaxID=3032002 RepID=UPI0023D9C168|nr:diguanylate cyclase [Petrocella sp. FN5]MDF1618784.1 diguanylate cyclase [Petrocella sp. FN5]